MENELQSIIIQTEAYKKWYASLPDWTLYEIQNSGFMLHHLIGKYDGYLDLDMTIPSLSVHIGLTEGLINILTLYDKLIKHANKTS